MAYYADSVTQPVVTYDGADFIIRGRTAYSCVQCYVAGRLHGFDIPVDGRVEFRLPGLGENEIVFLLAVDVATADTDYFDDAFPLAAASGNRITLRTYTEAGYAPTDRIRFYRGDDGDESADTLLDERMMFPSGQFLGGWGDDWGAYWGYGNYGPGWGTAWGREWGFDSWPHEYTIDPLPPGAYPVKVTIVDAVGNESTEDSETVTLATIPRPATDLEISSYVKATDTLTLAFTESEDL